MNRSKIEWCDYTFNPVTGCKHGCDYCYARKIARRFHGPNGFEPTFHKDRLHQPDREKRPSRIFVCSMADLFGSWVPRDWIQAVLQTVHHNPQHTFIFLTKNPKRYLVFNPWPWNAWLGATATDQRSFEDRFARLCRAKTSIRFISFEPLLGPVRFGPALNGLIDWIIIGAMTGPGAVKPRSYWVKDLTYDARGISAKVFHKDNLKLKKPMREIPSMGARSCQNLHP